jgi:FAD synthetase
LSQIAVLPDDKNLIAEHVALFSSKFDVVITSGGIGPTHDDITFESVAQAFDEEVAIDSELRSIVRKIFGNVADDSPHMKLCTIPRSSKLLFKGPDGTPFRYPIVTVNNVYVLPGIPSLFERAIGNIVGYWAQDIALHKKTIRLKCHETDVADVLTNASKLFSDVNIGSYPSWTNNYEKVLITIDSDNLEKVERCKNYLEEHISADKMIDENINCEPWMLEGADVLKLAEEDSQLGEKVRKAMEVIDEAIEKYGDGLSLAFNGGKDCTVLLHLYFAALKKNKSSARIKSIYIESDKSEMFEEMDEFLENSHKRYDIDVISTNGEIKEALCNHNKN